ncbi:DUF3857 domain-containing protein [Christiangramia sp.]|uniref:DUF3857 domain-containing protein n=1 Tax=Christiangramia sp. TaxID=1931228 RepID=UPI0032420491
MNKLFTTLFLFFSILIQAQTFNSKNASVTATDLTTNDYPADTTAHALVIYEKGFSEFDPNEDYDLVTEYVHKIKVLDKNGIEEVATIEIPLGKSYNSSSKERIDELEAFTYKLVDGRLSSFKLTPEKVYTQNFENYDLVKFTFPNVEPGDVLVYKYKLISPFISKFNGWDFQGDIPKINSEFTSKIPGNYDYHIALVGDQQLAKHDAEVIKRCISFGQTASMAGCVETIYAMTDIPAFKEEDFMTSADNFRSRLKFELKSITRLDGYVDKYTQEWDDVDEKLLTERGIGKQWKKDRLVEELLPADIKSIDDKLEKAKAIYAFVKNNYKWNGDYKIHDDIKLKDILKDHTGNIMSLNTLLYTVFKTEGYEVDPIMASTRQHGFITKVHPILTDFNYFFIRVHINGKNYYADASEKYLDFGRLPYRALNNYARLLDTDEGSSWIDIQPNEFSTISLQDSISVHKDGTATGSSKHTFTGYKAFNIRKQLSDTEKENYFTEFTVPNDHARATDLEVNNQDDLEEDLEIVYEMNNASQKINDQIYFNPFSFRFFQKNPFNLDKRTYPIDFGYKDMYMYSIQVIIPEGYTVAEMPESKALRLPGNKGSFLFAANKITENSISIQCRVSFTESIYGPEYYEGLKKFFNEILAVQQQSLIVLKENT